jgi:hypothetical protein
MRAKINKYDQTEGTKSWQKPYDESKRERVSSPRLRARKR